MSKYHAEDTPVPNRKNMTIYLPTQNLFILIFENEGKRNAMPIMKILPIQDVSKLQLSQYSV
jgi:hypothetical protein